MVGHEGGRTRAGGMSCLYVCAIEGLTGGAARERYREREREIQSEREREREIDR
jgi:hypothetical protein